jgi:type IV pilus assembly protein PilC
VANENAQMFKYEARTSNGQFIEGKIKAESTRSVAEFLVNKGYIPVDIKEQSALQKDISFGKKRVKPKTVAGFMRQFATLNGAGIPITRALDVLRDQAVNPTFKEVIGSVRKDIDTGSTLANSMAKHPMTFSPLSISMIRAGEAGGFLTETLGDVAENLEADVKLRGKIKSAMTYPVAVLILAAVLVVAMLLFIVPIFDKMFSSLGGQLPVATQILVTASNFIKVGGIPIAIAIAIFIWWWNKNKHKENIRHFVDPIKLKLPIFGKLIQKITIARFTRNFGSLLEAGLPVMQVMDIVGSTSGSTVLEDALVEVKKGVSQGELIAPQLSKHKIFPRMLVEMLSVGEDAGEIPGMMEKIAISYDEEVDSMTESLSSLMEPLMLMVLGGVVGGMVIALYMPIFSIYDLVDKK